MQQLRALNNWSRMEPFATATLHTPTGLGIDLKIQRLNKKGRKSQMLVSGSCGLNVQQSCTERRKCGKRNHAHLLPACSAKRKPKYPGEFVNYDEMPAHLQADKSGTSGGFSGFLNRLGNEAFGKRGKPGGASDHFYQGILQSDWLKSLDRTSNGPGYTVEDEEKERNKMKALESAAAKNPKTKELALLLVCSVEDAARFKMTVRCPTMLAMPLDEILSRMIFLRDLLPGYDVARMMSIAPRLFLDTNWDEAKVVMLKNASLLKDNLEPANVESMVQEDPELLFRDLSGSIENLFELWDIDEDTLRDCNPAHLALAIKAMSKDGPSPKV